ncbi:unnamed protein product [Lathyrus sativus]|nr:unnamed protein product [Lathyrus sativus]
MDFDDIEAPIKATSRVSRFAPKSSKLKPKTEQVLVPKSEPPSFPSTKLEPREIDFPAKPNGVQTTVPTNGTVNLDAESKSEAKLDSMDVDMTEAEVQEDSTHANPMEEDEEEDTVVREIDVYFSPSINGGTKLYVMQFPLRPSWRPYEFDEQCEEVRLKPESSEVEVDLSVDLESSNTDSDFSNELKYTKQTLSTTWKPPPANGCAVGLLMGDKLHLHPVHAVVQLRPSRYYLDSGGSEKKNAATSKKQNKRMNSSTEQKSDDDQCWVPLKYHGCKSDIPSSYFQQMVALESSPINFEMNTYDYIATLCPGVSSNTLAKGPSKRFLQSLPM